MEIIWWTGLAPWIWHGACCKVCVHEQFEATAVVPEDARVEALGLVKTLTEIMESDQALYTPYPLRICRFQNSKKMNSPENYMLSM